MSNPILLWVIWIRGSPGRSWASTCWRPVRSGPKSESLVQIRSKQASPWDCCSPWCKRWGDPGGCCRGLLCNSGRWRSGCRSPSAVASAEEPSVPQSVPMCSPSRRLNLQQERMITQRSYTVAWRNSRGPLTKCPEQVNATPQWMTLSDSPHPSNYFVRNANVPTRCYATIIHNL